MNHDVFSHLDAAYVLGALSPNDRQDYERHLEDCGACRKAVAEVAGLPGLLARVDPNVLDDAEEGRPGGPAVEAVPDTLLPRLLEEVGRTTRRSRSRAWAAGAAAAAAVAAVSVGVTLAVQDGPESSAPAAVARGRAMEQVDQTSLSARVAMEEVPWGTRLRITCRYAAARYDGAAAPAYSLVVHYRDGSDEQVATWRAVPGRPTTVVGATASRPSEIASVEVRTTAGEPVLRLDG